MSNLHDELPEAVEGGADPNVSDPAPVQGLSAGPAQDRRTVKQEQRRELVRNGSFIVGSVILGFWILCSLFPGLFTRFAEGDFVTTSEGVSVPPGSERTRSVRTSSPGSSTEPATS